MKERTVRYDVDCINNELSFKKAPLIEKYPKGMLFVPDETGSPCILPLSDAALLFPRIPEPTECTGSMSIAAFTELYLPYLAAQKLPLKPCPIPALLRLQENQQYDW